MKLKFNCKVDQADYWDGCTMVSLINQENTGRGTNFVQPLILNLRGQDACAEDEIQNKNVKITFEFE